MSDNTITLSVDGQEVEVARGSTVLDACKKLEIEVPHFCFHKRLSIAGNCRMCLVEIEGGPPKPAASCAMPAGDGMVVHTNSKMVVDARKGTMEFLLINHPLDCPICDQGGECDLQDMAVGYGSDVSHYAEGKRAVEDKDIGEKIKTVMTRCIHCMRCVRFATEVAGIEEFGATGRGSHVKVGTYVKHALRSELSGNMIDLCPVGALTSKPYAFVARPWELERTPSVDVMDGLGSLIEVHHRAGKVMRIVPRECDAVNEEWISDTARFSYDALTHERLTTPLLKKGRKQEGASWEKAFDAVKRALKGKETVAALAGARQSAEDLYAFNALMKETIETPHVDSRSENMLLDATNRSSYIMNSAVSGLDEADVILLVGCDPRLEMPVLNARMRRNVLKRNVAVASVGRISDLTYNVEDLGANPDVLTKLATARSGFSKILKAAKKPMIIVGAEALSTCKDSLAIIASAQTLAEKVGAVTPHWNGFNMLHQHMGLVSALDMGVIPAPKGMHTGQIKKALQAGKVDVLFVYGDTDITPEEMAKAKYSIYLGTHDTVLSQQANVVLPTAAYTEKSGLWANTEGRVLEAQKAVNPPLNAKEDWKVFRALSSCLGEALPFDTLEQLRGKIVEQNAAYASVGVHTLPEWEVVKAKMKVSSKKLDASVAQFYLNNSFLRASAAMHRCQAESDAPETELRRVG